MARTGKRSMRGVQRTLQQKTNQYSYSGSLADRQDCLVCILLSSQLLVYHNYNYQPSCIYHPPSICQVGQAEISSPILSCSHHCRSLPPSPTGVLENDVSGYTGVGSSAGLLPVVRLLCAGRLRLALIATRLTAGTIWPSTCNPPQVCGPGGSLRIISAAHHKPASICSPASTTCAPI